MAIGKYLGIWGDHFQQNIDAPVSLETEQWYCFEMMLKTNTPGRHDGELKMWIYGILKGHIQNMRFRACDTLKINEFTHSAYVGGNWVSKRDQRLWDDNLVIAREYIGPMTEPAAPIFPGEPDRQGHATTSLDFYLLLLDNREDISP